MDGLAAGIAAIAAFFLGINFYLNGQTQEAAISATLVGAALGFLAFNRKPASIFMGDCGALFLGFLLGGMSLWSDYGRTRNILAVLATPLLIFLIPILDTSIVTLCRKLSGRPASQGGRDHMSHRLVALGLSEKNAVEMLYLFAFASGAFTLVLRFVAPDVTLFAIPAFALGVVLLGLYIGEVKIYDANEIPRSGFSKLFIELSHKRRLFEVLLDALIIPLAYYAAYLIRWDGSIPDQQLQVFLRTVPAVVGLKLILFLVVGMYDGLWRYASIKDLVQIIKITLGSSALTAFAILAAYGFVGPSRGVLVLDALVLLLMVAASRTSFRIFHELLRPGTAAVDPNKRPLLIYGAGDEAELLLRDLQGGLIADYTAVALIDAEQHLVGKRLRGYPVYSVDEAQKIAANYGSSDIVIATKNPIEKDLQQLKNFGLSVRRLSIKIE
jgi:UDP-GlcNAc:undecaprenyl-phosphate GlcNAc-1-phosphate transferase